MLPAADVVPGGRPFAVPAAELAAVDAAAAAAAPFFLGDRAFSAQLPKRLDTLLCLVGDLASPSAFSAAGVGRTLGGFPPGVGRNMVWMLVDAGERTLAVLSGLASVRGFFFGASDSTASPPFSLLLPEISLLNVLAGVLPRKRVSGGGPT